MIISNIRALFAALARKRAEAAAKTLRQEQEAMLDLYLSALGMRR